MSKQGTKSKQDNLAGRLVKIQSELKAPKNQFNKVGNFKYRNVEDILEAVKPLLLEHGLLLTLSDEIIMLGERFYIKADATIIYKDEVKTITAYAREEVTKKGMDGSQITGSSSSYARKYALNGLFLIDDTKDSDTTNQPNQKVDDLAKQIDRASKYISNVKSLDDLKSKVEQFVNTNGDVDLVDLYEAKVEELKNAQL